MTIEQTCIFNRDSKCIFKGGVCDLDCDTSNCEGNTQLAEEPDILDRYIGERKRKFNFTLF